MIQDPIWHLAASITRFTAASALLAGRTAAVFLVSPDVSNSMHDAADVLERATKALRRADCGCHAMPASPPVSTGWGPVGTDD